MTHLKGNIIFVLNGSLQFLKLFKKVLFKFFMTTFFPACPFCSFVKLPRFWSILYGLNSFIWRLLTSEKNCSLDRTNSQNNCSSVS